MNLIQILNNIKIILYLYIMWKLLLLFMVCVNGYKRPFYNSKKSNLFSKKETPPTMWTLVSAPFKEEARKWFIKRAILKGIDWHNITNRYKGPQAFSEILKLKQELQNITMKYPDYFLQPFHGYDNGNMNWDAAQELEAASLSMSANYWKDACVMDSETWVRNNVTNNIKYYTKQFTPDLNIDYILDVGSSGGISTEYLSKGFPEASRVYGLDLSPYFVAVSAFRAKQDENYKLHYVHQNAEETNFKNNSFDLIVCNFFFHEVPFNATNRIINELSRLIKPHGVLAIVDLDPTKVTNNLIVNQFRKWAFEVTEPHIYEYYNNNMSNTLIEKGFNNVIKVNNDPINSIWFGTKPSECTEDECICDEDENCCDDTTEINYSYSNYSKEIYNSANLDF